MASCADAEQPFVCRSASCCQRCRTALQCQESLRLVPTNRIRWLQFVRAILLQGRYIHMRTLRENMGTGVAPNLGFLT